MVGKNYNENSVELVLLRLVLPNVSSLLQYIVLFHQLGLVCLSVERFFLLRSPHNWRVVKKRTVTQHWWKMLHNPNWQVSILGVDKLHSIMLLKHYYSPLSTTGCSGITVASGIMLPQHHRQLMRLASCCRNITSCSCIRGRILVNAHLRTILRNMKIYEIL